MRETENFKPFTSKWTDSLLNSIHGVILEKLTVVKLEIHSHLSWISKIHCRVHKNLPRAPILKQVNPVDTHILLLAHVLIISSNLRPGFRSNLLLSWLKRHTFKSFGEAPWISTCSWWQKWRKRFDLCVWLHTGQQRFDPRQRQIIFSLRRDQLRDPPLGEGDPFLRVKPCCEVTLTTRPI